MFARSLPLLAILIFSGCSSVNQEPVKPVEVITIQKQAPVFHPALPNALNLRKLEWRVWTPALMKQYVEDLEKGEASTVVQYGLTPQGYEALSYNISDLQMYIKQIRSILKYYKEQSPSEGEELNIPE